MIWAAYMHAVYYLRILRKRKARFPLGDLFLLKLNRFLISSSRQLTRQKKKSLRAKNVAWWKTGLIGVSVSLHIIALTKLELRCLKQLIQSEVRTPPSSPLQMSHSCLLKGDL